MRDKALRRTALIGMTLWVCTTANAQLLEPEARSFSFQAKLSGVSDGAHQLHITLFDGDGGQVGATIDFNATVQNGIVSEQIPLADVSVFDEGQRLWAEVSVDADPPLSPRIPLIAVPYSFRVHQVGSVELDDDVVLGSAAASGSLQLYDDQGAVVITLLGTGDPAVDVTGTVRMGGVIVDEPTEPGFVLTSDSWGRGTWQSLPLTSGYWTANGNDIYSNNAGDVGIGTITPQYPLHVTAAVGHALHSASTDGTGVYGLHDASTGIDPGVQGTTNSTSEDAAGVIGMVSPTNPGAYSAGVRGINNGTSSFGVGVWGSQDGFGWGVYGTAVGGIGVRGRATATTGANYGVYGQSDSTGGRGMHGVATALTGPTYGVYGESRSEAGHALHGVATALTGDAYGVHAESRSDVGRGVYGLATSAAGDTYGVYGESRSDAGVGVFGAATSVSGFVAGGRFECVSPSGRAVMGINDATTGSQAYGVYGQTSSNTGAGVRGTADPLTGKNYGVSGESSSTEGRGVFGTANQTSGPCYGVYGRSFSTSGTGVFGQATNPSGSTQGGAFISESSDGTGVYGGNNATTGVAKGIVGHTASQDGVAIQGTNAVISGYLSGTGVAGSGYRCGVYGSAFGASTLYGVYGTIDGPTGWALYGVGDFAVTGTKAFRIDHPLQPEEKYLNHYCAEGPEPLLIYRGNVKLDARGAAWVELPAYFEALNRDFHYQLTAIGAPSPDLHVAEKVRDNRFRVAGGAPFAEVSWTVTGVRNDPYVAQHGAPVEQLKPESERGKYLHPELYGQPPESAVHYVPGEDRTAAQEPLEHENQE